jgi:hypothetical protein
MMHDTVSIIFAAVLLFGWMPVFDLGASGEQLSVNELT